MSLLVSNGVARVAVQLAHETPPGWEFGRVPAEYGAQDLEARTAREPDREEGSPCVRRPSAIEKQPDDMKVVVEMAQAG
ncbi:MAG TPA: hypothetical protein VEF89_13175 [Solirubrobacteraceae bacterium]|nr:hypothetical protein [Solirubrobacteraceae bacterium]